MKIDFRNQTLLDAIGGQLTPEGSVPSGALVAQRNGPWPRMHDARDASVEDTPIRILQAQDRIDCVLVFLLGLGPTWTTGTYADYETMVRKYAERTGALAILVDWRATAPTYPDSVDAAMAVLRWTRSNIDAVAAPSVPLVLAGHGAGGNLAAAAALRARDEPDIAPDIQFLICPTTDATASRNTPDAGFDGLILRSDQVESYFADYALEEHRSSDEVSPLVASDLSRVAPAIVATAAFDPLLSEGEAYADRLRDAGRLVSYRSYGDQVHGFPLFIELPLGERLSQQLIKPLLRFQAKGADSLIEADC